MEKQRGTVVAVIAALVVAVISLGVAFAAFSTTLNINGSATVEATHWEIYFSDTGSEDSQPTANSSISSITPSNTLGYTNTVTATGTYASDTSITWQASFKSAGDKVVYKFYVRNDGDFNAAVSNTPVSRQGSASGETAFTCTKGGNAETSVCSHIHYGLYEDAAGTTPVAQDLALAAHSSDEYYLIAWLDESYGGNDGSGLADTDVTTASITTTVTYQQSSSAVNN
jgi:hypothetical protein